MRTLCIVVALAACGRLEFEDVPRGDARFGEDARALGPWSTPVPLTDVNLISPDDDPSITADGLELYFNSSSPRPGYIAQGDLFVATRTTPTDSFGPSTIVALSTNEDETRPVIAPDGLALYYGAVRTDAQRDLFVATRANRTAPWGPEMVLGVGDPLSNEATAIVAEGGLAVYFDSAVSGNNELYVARRSSTGAAWGAPEPLATVNDPSVDDGEHWVSEDGLLLLFGSTRAGGQGFAIWEATRASTSEPFSAPRLVSELDSPGADSDPFLTPDLRTIYFSSNRSGDADLYMATR